MHFLAEGLLERFDFRVDRDNRPVVDRAAREWVALVDEKKYGDSWDRAATLFKKRITREQWAKAVSVTRGALGEVKRRDLLVAVFRKRLPGLPDGQYAIVVYRTQFAKKPRAVEAITLALEAKHWRSCGYFVR